MKHRKISLFDLWNNLALLLVAFLCVYRFLYVFFVAASDGTFLARAK